MTSSKIELVLIAQPITLFAHGESRFREKNVVVLWAGRVERLLHSL